MSELGNDHQDLILDGTKLAWHLDRVEKWQRGERVAPITIDMALTRACNYSCGFCYAMFQENDRKVINKKVIFDFLEDCAEIGVKGISFVSDGESTISPVFTDACKYGHELGLSMAVGTNAFVLTKNRLEDVMPYLTYLRVNFSAGEKKRYAEIMGVKESSYDRVCQNIRDMVEIKKKNNLKVTIGMQMVLMPEDADQIIPLAKLGKELRPDYAIIKHCSDNEDGGLGILYDEYEKLYPLLKEAEGYSDETYKCVIKWSKIKDKGNNKRSYQRCYGAPFMIQLSGSGLVAPCGGLFNEKYKKFHIGNICDTRFKDIWKSDKYWEVMNYLSSPKFNAQKMCASLCLQHKVNETLDDFVKGKGDLKQPDTESPEHINFI
ncbi:radical SAM protein [Candidatus Pelagibacter sp.]|jgi:MoaA/NifB/PqqE/SkfB family radical SAM enzyme|nr:radical SAM protein [Candidatus Pelagibacter sp.]|tara:strand:+ start:1917 stop:3047 length:1131 start_codon:yes stop_codon:yes gene_type:complete